MEIPSFMRPHEPTIFEAFEQRIQADRDAAFRRIAATDSRKRSAADESKFDKLKGKLAHRKGVTNPAGLAAYIGREKYGKKGMAAKAAAGRSGDCAMDEKRRARMHDALERVLGSRAAQK